MNRGGVRLTAADNSAILSAMDVSEPHGTRSVDVTGLPDSAVRAVEQFVAQLRTQQNSGVPPQFRSREEWAQAIRDWAASHPKRDTLADDSREAIYADDRDE